MIKSKEILSEEPREVLSNGQKILLHQSDDPGDQYRAVRFPRQSTIILGEPYYAPTESHSSREMRRSRPKRVTKRVK